MDVRANAVIPPTSTSSPCQWGSSNSKGFALGHPEVEVAAFYRIRARFGARAYPPLITSNLLATWIADTRGESFVFGPGMEGFIDAENRFRFQFKEELEEAARRSGIDIDVAMEMCGANLYWLLKTHPHMKLREAFKEYNCLLKVGKTSFSEDMEVLRLAYEYCRHSIVEWFVLNEIPHYLEYCVIPATRITKALEAFVGVPDIYFGDSIPPDKLANAKMECWVPDEEEICILIDCTFWGSAKDALLFGLKAIYFKNGDIEGFLPYSEFPAHTFNGCADNLSHVSLGDGLRVDLTGSNVKAQQCISMLEIVRKEATASNEQSDGPGLDKIPGMHSLKATLTEDIINALKNPDEYKKYGLAIPNGLLFYGPPGCGKTFVAQRLAKELDYNFYEVSPATVASPYIHDTVLKIKQIFDKASKSAPSMIFVDEFEGLVPARRYLSGDGQYKAEEVNEWLTQIGTCSDRNILFVAATNEPWKIDEAIRRTGRLDKKIYVGPPDRDAIKEIIVFHCATRPLESDDVAEQVAALIDGQGYSASDLKALVDESAKLAMKDRNSIGVRHFEKAAAERVRPSISAETEALFLEFS
jgi:transitional endoplasmic reticulum ATPase